MSKKNITEADISRGARLSELFESSNMTDADVARSMRKKSRAVPGRWRSGESFLTKPDEIARLARVLGTTPEYIMFGNSIPSINQSSNPPSQIKAEPQPEKKQGEKDVERVDKLIEMMNRQNESLVKINEYQSNVIASLTASNIKLAEEISSLKEEIKNSNNPRSFSSTKKTVNGDSPGE